MQARNRRRSNHQSSVDRVQGRGAVAYPRVALRRPMAIWRQSSRHWRPNVVSSYFLTVLFHTTSPCSVIVFINLNLRVRSGANHSKLPRSSMCSSAPERTSGNDSCVSVFSRIRDGAEMATAAKSEKRSTDLTTYRNPRPLACTMFRCPHNSQAHSQRPIADLCDTPASPRSADKLPMMKHVPADRRHPGVA